MGMFVMKILHNKIIICLTLLIIKKRLEKKKKSRRTLQLLKEAYKFFSSHYDFIS